MYSIESFINYVYEDDNDYATEGIGDIAKKALEKIRSIGKWIVEKAKSFGKWIMNIILNIKSKFSKSGKSCNANVLKEGMAVINSATSKANESLLDSIFGDEYDIVLEGNNTKKNKRAEKQNASTNLAISKQKNKMKKELTRLNTIKNGTYGKPGRELTNEEKARYNELRTQIRELEGVKSDNEDKIEKIKDVGKDPVNSTPTYVKIADQQQNTADKIEQIAKKYDNDPEFNNLAKVFRKYKTRVKTKDLPAASAMNIIISESKKTSDAVTKETEKITKAIKENEKKLFQTTTIIGGGSDYIIGQGLEPTNGNKSSSSNSNTSSNANSQKSNSTIKNKMYNNNSELKNVVEDSAKKQNWFIRFLKRIIKKIKAIIDTLKVAFA